MCAVLLLVFFVLVTFQFPEAEEAEILERQGISVLSFLGVSGEDGVFLCGFTTRERIIRFRSLAEGKEQILRDVELPRLPVAAAGMTDGRVLVLFSTGVLWKYDIAAKSASSSSVSRPRTIACFCDGYFVAVSSSRVLKITKDGEKLDFGPAPFFPSAITACDANNVFLVSSDEQAAAVYSLTRQEVLATLYGQRFSVVCRGLLFAVVPKAMLPPTALTNAVFKYPKTARVYLRWENDSLVSVALPERCVPMPQDVFCYVLSNGIRVFNCRGEAKLVVPGVQCGQEDERYSVGGPIITSVPPLVILDDFALWIQNGSGSVSRYSLPSGLDSQGRPLAQLASVRVEKDGSLAMAFADGTIVTKSPVGAISPYARVQLGGPPSWVAAFEDGFIYCAAGRLIFAGRNRAPLLSPVTFPPEGFAFYEPSGNYVAVAVRRVVVPEQEIVNYEIRVYGRSSLFADPSPEAITSFVWQSMGCEGERPLRNWIRFIDGYHAIFESVNRQEYKLPGNAGGGLAYPSFFRSVNPIALHGMILNSEKTDEGDRYISRVYDVARGSDRSVDVAWAIADAQVVAHPNSRGIIALAPEGSICLIATIATDGTLGEKKALLPDGVAVIAVSEGSIRCFSAIGGDLGLVRLP